MPVYEFDENQRHGITGDMEKHISLHQKHHRMRQEIR